MKQNTIYIIGTGVMGKALGVLLTHEGKEVILLRGSVDDQPDAFERMEIEVAGAILSAEIKIATMSNYPVLNGVIVFANKSYGNPALAHKLKSRIGNSPVVIIQNGLNVEEPFLDNHFPHIYRCVPFASSQYVSPNKLRFKPAAVSPIGIIKGDEEMLKSIVENLQNTHFVFQAEKNIHPIIWTKTIINCVLNSVCPLLETDNGIFHRNTEIEDMAKKLVRECLSIANASGISLSFEAVMNRLLMISKSSDGQLISTYQDLINRRPTEIDSFNFAIVKIAEQFNKSDLVSNIRLLGELIKYRSALQVKA